MKWVFDLKEEDTYWCSADIGWVTGHSYIVYGPLAAGATSVMYEGAPDFPQFDRWWRIVEKYRISILYTSPTAIRALIRQGDQWPNAHDLSSLRLLGSVGEPINPAAWEWYNRVIGKGRCPIVDTWWQTETGGILIAPMPGAVPAKPGSGTLPMPGIIPAIVDLKGIELGADKEGFLILKKPWPGMIRGIWGDPERYKEQYWTRVPGAYFTGDAARRDADGYYWVLGRVDDVMNVSGHRLSTMEVESALVLHPEESQILLLDALPRVLTTFPESLSAAAERQLVRLGVRVIPSVRVTEIDSTGVTYSTTTSAERIEAHTVLWAAGVKPSPWGQILARRVGAELDRTGRVKVNADLTIPGHPEIFVIGDLAYREQNGVPLPGIAPVAMQEGRYAASVVVDRLKGQTSKPFSYFDKGYLAVVGRKSGVGVIGGLKLHGFIAWFVWLFVHLMYLAQALNRVLVFLRWGYQYVTFYRGARLITGDDLDGRVPPER